MASTHDYEFDKRNEDIQVHINGEFFHRSEAKVSVMDSGYLLGDGVWEGIRLHRGHLVHLDEHLDRLYAGAKAIAMDIGLTREGLVNALRDTLERNGMESNVHIRLIVSRGIKKTPYQSPRVTIGKPTVVIIPEYKKASEEVKERGITLATVKTRRDHFVQDPKINSLSKHNCIAACIEADRLGVDEGLMLDPHGFVSTCNSTNFFIVRDEEVWTSTGEYCLNGVTRGAVIRLCREYDVSVLEKNFIPKDVHSADEVFVSGTFAGVIPVISVDGNKIGSGTRGPATKNLQDWYALDIDKRTVG
ncbi:MAG TPA: aminotransferase class IV [Candidatus Marinimicrobia bacterium]|nr:aminotransferase class IV [Candidatus Neomarinimicrobiota bacterium]HIB33224.1 aminotransferase class IV [Candidatus Neomarinimicrobiota bacterium]